MSYNLLQDDIGACETVHKINWKCFILKICTIVFHSIIIFTGIFVGIYLSTLLMFLASGSLNSRFLGYFTQLLVFIGFNGLFLYFIFQILYEKAIKKSILYSYIISQALYIIMLPIFLFVFYLPAPKSPEFTNEPSGYWLLETGSNISYYEYGQITSEKYPFVFLHGGPGAPVLGKEHFVDELVSVGYHVYQYDQLGGGKSSRLNKVNDYTLDRQIKDLESIRNKIGASKINIICHSFGGTLASNYIASYPDRVSQCIFISPGNLCESNDESSLTKDGSVDQMNCLMKNKRFLFAQLCIAVLPPPQGLFVLMPEKTLDDLFVHFHDGLNMMPGSGKFYNTKGSGFGFWANLMIGNDLPACQQDKFIKFNGRALIIKGQFDYISFDVTYKYRKFIPNSTLITIDGMGHSVDPSHQSEIWDNILSFIVNGTTKKQPYNGDVSPWK